MRSLFSSLSCLSLLAMLIIPAAAQDIGRVTPANLPLPMPKSGPIAPDVLRAHNPWNLPMTGEWKFALTHGQIKSNVFVPDSGDHFGITASSHEEKNLPENAFDDTNDTRWCASNDSVPQWLQTDLGHDRSVSSVNLTWEHDTGGYRCLIEGKKDGGQWQTLADLTAEPGIGDGPVTIKPATVRYVRITVVGCGPGSWASIREFQIHLAENGQDVVWQPLNEPQPAQPVVSPDAFAAIDFDDVHWDKIPVPSNWEMLGYSDPTYGWVDNTVGEYRRWVKIPADWANRKIYWHFDGALDGAEVFINGQKAGYHESGYTAWNIDLTGLLKPGERNLFAVRVSKSVPSAECETGDYQCMGGIYRDMSLISVPTTHVSDITVQTPLDANYQNATLNVSVQVSGPPGQGVVLDGELFDGTTKKSTGVKISGQAGLSADGTGIISLTTPVQSPALWSAEKPNLYYLVLQLKNGDQLVERVEQRFGFKQIDFKDNRVLWNGQPIKCTGSCRHDYWADRGFALTEANWEQDLTMMKGANINAIRTSHYNHAQRFLELCEERGMYILDEVPYCWIGDSVKDPAFAPYLLQRATETLARDKNRPCVLAWSIGNENPMGPDSQAVIDYVKATDPTRPAFVSCQGTNDVKGQIWDDDHYPSPQHVDEMIKINRPINYSENPHIFWQPEEHAYDPGVHDLWSEALQNVWTKIWPATNVLGSFIWEWQCQGIADKNGPVPHQGPWGPDNLRQENYKGIVTAYRVAKPEWWIVKQVYSPVQIGISPAPAMEDTFSVPITNHYSFTDLGELTCHWSVYQGGKILQHGSRHIPCAPLNSTTASFPLPSGATKLHLEFDHVDGRSIVSVNIPVTGAPVPMAPPALPAGNALSVLDSGSTLCLSNNLEQIVFDKSAGTVHSWRVRGRDIVVGGPILNLGEAKTSGEKHFYHAAQPPFFSEVRTTAAAPDADGTVHVSVAAGVLTAVNGSSLGPFTCEYLIHPNAEITLNWQLNWGTNNTDLWEDGLKVMLPADKVHMGWLRDAYFTDYPADHLGAPTGSCDAGDVRFRASKRNLQWLTLTDDSGTGVALLRSSCCKLIGRAETTDTAGVTLFGTSQISSPRDFSGSWATIPNVTATKDGTLTGGFTLRALAP